MTFKRISIDADAWMKSKADHHVFRITHECPCCATVWSFDVTDTPAGFVCPSEIQLGLSMLCGACEARRRISFRYVNQNQVTEWSSPFFTEQEEAATWAKIRSGKYVFTRIKKLEPYTDQVLIDEKRSLLRILTRKKVSPGRYVAVLSMTDGQLIESGQKWTKPTRANATISAGWR